jgi:membrane protease YdiL (CAAX protease family)
VAANGGAEESRSLREGNLTMTTADNAAQLPDAAPREGLLAQHPLVFYFLIAYAGTWLLSLPCALSEDGAGLLPFSSSLLVFTVFAIGPFSGPTLSAFIMTGIIEGRAGIRRLLGRYVLWRVGLGWYLFALIVIPAIQVLGVFVLRGTLPSFEVVTPLYVPTYLGSFVIVLIFGAPLGEEPGWRGFALPHLQQLHGPLVGSLILGILWAFWHLPLFWITTWDLPPTILNIVPFVVADIAFTVIITWVFNNTKGSLLIAILVHTSINAFSNGPLPLLFPTALTTDSLALPLLVGYGAVALVLVALTRGRLGYQHYHPEGVHRTTASA